MYAGFLTSKHTSKWLGSHQKLNKLAYRLLADSEEANTDKLPGIKAILSFEGLNGPDGIKVKSPSQNEPHHFYDPTDSTDRRLIDLLNLHSQELITALSASNTERSAFEAAWLSHAITDGLTPAHQFPFHDELESIRGEPDHTRTSTSKKLFAKGETRRQTLAKNWKLWGNKGLMLTHYNFELGVATVLLTIKMKKTILEASDFEEIERLGIEKYFRAKATKVYGLHMYDRFYRHGWSTALARDVRTQLIPIIVKAIALSWYLCLKQAQK